MFRLIAILKFLYFKAYRYQYLAAIRIWKLVSSSISDLAKTDLDKKNLSAFSNKIFGYLRERSGMELI